MYKVKDTVWDYFQDQNVTILSVDDNTIPTTYTVMDDEGMEYYVTEDDVSESQE